MSHIYLAQPCRDGTLLFPTVSTVPSLEEEPFPNLFLCSSCVCKSNYSFQGQFVISRSTRLHKLKKIDSNMCCCRFEKSDKLTVSQLLITNIWAYVSLYYYYLKFHIFKFLAKGFNYLHVWIKRNLLFATFIYFKKFFFSWKETFLAVCNVIWIFLKWFIFWNRWQRQYKPTESLKIFGPIRIVN